jgi:GntR family transcriptional regulator
MQLAAELRQAIQTGEYQPGDRLPSRRRLAEANGIAVMTVQHALDVLTDEGLVVAQHGRGVFVQDPKTTAVDDQEPSRSLEDMLAQAQRDLAEANALLDRYQAAYPEPPEPDIGPAPDQAPGIDL